jgi:hypothetical protein
MEEMLGNIAGARQIFERWMKWEPDHHGWTAYIKARRFFLRHCTGSFKPVELCILSLLMHDTLYAPVKAQCLVA